MSDTQKMRPVGNSGKPAALAWQTPFETPPFAEILPEHFLPASSGLCDHSAEIGRSPTIPRADFANTSPLERSGKLLSIVSACLRPGVGAPNRRSWR